VKRSISSPVFARALRSFAISVLSKISWMVTRFVTVVGFFSRSGRRVGVRGGDVVGLLDDIGGKVVACTNLARAVSSLRNSCDSLLPVRMRAT